MPGTARLEAYFQALTSGNRQVFRDLCASVAFRTSEVADGASAVAHYLDSPAYVTAGAKLLSVRNATVEKFSVGYDGVVRAPTYEVWPLNGSSGYTSGHRITSHGSTGYFTIQCGFNDGLYRDLLYMNVFQTYFLTGACYFSGLISAAGPISGATGTITASTPGLALTQTWNNALTTFKALTVDITDTASASGSLLMDLMVGGTSKFSVGKGGAVTAASYGFATVPFTIGVSGETLYFGSNYGIEATLTRNGGGFVVGADPVGGVTGTRIEPGAIYLGNVGQGMVGHIYPSYYGILLDTNLMTMAFYVGRAGGDGANKIGSTTTGGADWRNVLDDGTGNSYIQPVWNAGATTFTAFKVNVTDTASASGSLLMDLQVDAASKFSVNKSGNAVFAGHVLIGGNAYLEWISSALVTYGTFQANKIQAGSYGSVSAPVFTFSGDQTTGIYASGAGNMRFTVSGNQQMLFGGSYAQFIVPIYAPDGSASAPSITFANHTNYGVWYDGSNVSIAFSTGGSKKFDISNGSYIGVYDGNIFMGASLDVRLCRDAANILALKYDTNAQEFRVYGTTTGPAYISLIGAASYTELYSTNLLYVVAGSYGWAFNTVGNLYPTLTGTQDLGNPSYRVAAYYGGGNTVTASTPVLNLTQTWNSGAVDFVGILADFTSTASGAGSLLMDLRVGGSSMFKVGKTNVESAGPIYSGNGSSVNGAFYARTTPGYSVVLQPEVNSPLNGAGAGLTMGLNGLVSWDASGSAVNNTRDTGLGRNAAGVVEVNNGTLGTYRDLIARNLELTGTLKFGTHSAIGAETVTGYVTITDAAGNSRKLAVVS